MQSSATVARAPSCRRPEGPTTPMAVPGCRSAPGRSGWRRQREGHRVPPRTAGGSRLRASKGSGSDPRSNSIGSYVIDHIRPDSPTCEFVNRRWPHPFPGRAVGRRPGGQTALLPRRCRPPSWPRPRWPVVTRWPRRAAARAGRLRPRGQGGRARGCPVAAPTDIEADASARTSRAEARGPADVC